MVPELNKRNSSIKDDAATNWKIKGLLSRPKLPGFSIS